MVAAAALPGSRVEIEDVGLNPTRTGAARRAAALRRARRGATTTATDGRRAARHGRRSRAIATGAVEIAPDGGSRPDRRTAGDRGARRRTAARSRSAAPPSCASRRAIASPRSSPASAALGIDADERPDGFVVRGPARGRRPAGGVADARGDHRMAMAFAIAALARRAARRRIDGAGRRSAISYPGFFETLGAGSSA